MLYEFPARAHINGWNLNSRPSELWQINLRFPAGVESNLLRNAIP
jgi:hypothetical protein